MYVYIIFLIFLYLLKFVFTLFRFGDTESAGSSSSETMIGLFLDAGFGSFETPTGLKYDVIVF